MFRSAVLVAVLAVGIHLYVGDGWQEANIPPLAGKTAVVTGANTGLGYETVRMMANAGSDVVMACRNLQKCEAARSSLQTTAKGTLQVMLLDLSEPNSIANFAQAVKEKVPKVDYLINNAAIMAVPEQTNSRGWELQFATNHLGQFALVQHLLPLLKASKTRIVNHASSAAHILWPVHPINLTDVMFQKGRPYDPAVAYCQTKRANLWFTYELNRRYLADGITSTSCHPGYSATELQQKADGLPGVRNFLVDYGNKYMAQSPAVGALPQVYAAVHAQPDDYIGPVYYMIGPPIKVGHSLRAFPFPADEPKGPQDLWELSAKLTGLGV
jgi:NAD(P)-dependent dehydrogenase (short-subunit alcohol dehydrogenase family)